MSSDAERTAHYERAALDKLAVATRRKQAQADRAFKRWIDGEVSTSSAARRLQNEADEKWRRLTSRPMYDPELHGERGGEES